MKSFRSRQVRRVLVPVMAVSLLSACGGWYTVHNPRATAVVADNRPDLVRFNLLDGSRVEVARPQIHDQQFVGERTDSGGAAIPGDTVRIPVDSVFYLATPIKDKETGLVPVVWFGIIVLLAWSVIDSIRFQRP